MLKKIISLIMTAVIFCSCICLNASAAENSITKQKLGFLIECTNAQFMWWGRTILYSETNLSKESDLASEVYYSGNSTEEDYQTACENLLKEHYNRYIYPWYAEDTLLNAEKEQNYNNLYSEDDWNDFQSKISDLKALFEGIEYRDYKYIFTDSQQTEITNAFHALLKSYNTMTNKNAIKGDVDGNGKVDVDDATLVQKYLAEEEKLTGAQKMRACVSDSERYEKANISDVTAIQKYAAGLVTEFPNHQIFVSDIESCESEDYLMSHLINFNICPRVKVDSWSRGIVNNGTYDSMGAQSYYIWCEENGIEP